MFVQTTRTSLPANTDRIAHFRQSRVLQTSPVPPNEALIQAPLPPSARWTLASAPVAYPSLHYAPAWSTRSKLVYRLEADSGRAAGSRESIYAVYR